MNDYKNNWFYKLCKKQCAKETWIPVTGAVIAALGVVSLVTKISLAGFGFLVTGLITLYFGMQVRKKLPMAGSYLQNMPQEEFMSLGSSEPHCMYDTLYFSERYLCIPSCYVMIRYDDIGTTETEKNFSRKSPSMQTGVSLKISFTDSREPLVVHVKDWVAFQNDINNFDMLVKKHKNELREQQRNA